MNNDVNSAGLLRLAGVMTICVGAVWALQVLAFAGSTDVGARLTWILAAAAISGGGVGLIFASSSLPKAEAFEV